MALIDAGAGVDPDQLLARVAASGVAVDRVRQLFITHAHADHWDPDTAAAMGLRVIAPAFDDDEVGGAGGIVFDYTGVKLQYRYSAANRFGETTRATLSMTPW